MLCDKEYLTRLDPSTTLGLTEDSIYNFCIGDLVFGKGQSFQFSIYIIIIMYACIYNAHTFSNDTESEALAVTGQHGKGVDGLFEKVSFFARRLKMSGATFCQCH